MGSPLGGGWRTAVRDRGLPSDPERYEWRPELTADEPRFPSAVLAKLLGGDAADLPPGARVHAAELTQDGAAWSLRLEFEGPAAEDADAEGLGVPVARGVITLPAPRSPPVAPLAHPPVDRESPWVESEPAAPFFDGTEGAPPAWGDEPDALFDGDALHDRDALHDGGALHAPEPQPQPQRVGPPAGFPSRGLLLRVDTDGRSAAGVVGDLAAKLGGKAADTSLLPAGELPAWMAPIKSALSADGEGAPTSLFVSVGRVGGATRLDIQLPGVHVELWGTAAGWTPLLHIDSLDLPAGVPLDPGIRSLLRGVQGTWTPKAIPKSAARRAIPAGARLFAVLPLHETPLFRALALPPTEVEIELGHGRPVIEFDLDLLEGGRVVTLFPGVRVHEFGLGFTSPARAALRVGCDLTVPFGDEPTLRFRAVVAADLVAKDLIVGLAMLGRVEGDAVGPWRAPFGFPGLTLGKLEVMLGRTLRAFSGEVAIGRASMSLQAVVDGGSTPPRSAVRFHGEHLTIQDLLDGFTDGAAGRLPAALGESGFRFLHVEYATTGFTFEWPSGERQAFRQGLRGAGHLSIFGLEFEAEVDLKAGRLAASMSPLTFGSLLRIEAPTTTRTRDTFADAVVKAGVEAGRTGPWLDVDLKKGQGEAHASISVLGFRRELHAEIAKDHVVVQIAETLDAAGVLKWHAALSVTLRGDGGRLSAGITGTLEASLTVNPADLVTRLGGNRPAMLDIDLVSIAVHVDVSVQVLGRAVDGRLAASLVLWGEAFPIEIALHVELDLHVLARQIRDRALTIATSVVENVGRLLLKAVEAAVAAIGAVLERVGAELRRALDGLVTALAELGEALEALGDLLDAIGAEIASWFGNDKPKRWREAAARRRVAVAAEEEARHRADAARIREQRRLAMLDILEHLADHALLEPHVKDEIEQRIHAYDCAAPINPFTADADFIPGATRETYEHLWCDALARARRRQELRSRYNEVRQEAERLLTAIRAEKRAAEADAARARTELDAARTELDALKDRIQEVADAHGAAVERWRAGREAALQVEVAIEAVDWLVERIRSRGVALADEGAHLEALTKVPTPDPTGAAVLDRIAELLVLGDLARADEQSRVALLERAFDDARSRVAAIEARCVEVLTARDALTLARLEGVQSVGSVDMTAQQVFRAWMDMVRRAGSPEQRMWEGELRTRGLALLAALPDLAEASARTAEGVLGGLAAPAHGAAAVGGSEDLATYTAWAAGERAPTLDAWWKGWDGPGQAAAAPLFAPLAREPAEAPLVAWLASVDLDDVVDVADDPLSVAVEVALARCVEAEANWRRAAARLEDATLRARAETERTKRVEAERARQREADEKARKEEADRKAEQDRKDAAARAEEARLESERAEEARRQKLAADQALWDLLWVPEIERLKEEIRFLPSPKWDLLSRKRKAKLQERIDELRSQRPK